MKSPQCIFFSIQTFFFFFFLNTAKNYGCIRHPADIQIKKYAWQYYTGRDHWSTRHPHAQPRPVPSPLTHTVITDSATVRLHERCVLHRDTISHTLTPLCSISDMFFKNQREATLHVLQSSVGSQAIGRTKSKNLYPHGGLPDWHAFQPFCL